jgi:phage replication-related protein YjqB (UPF0714/DUF867 family)
MAIHGGGIEPGTTQIGDAIAGRAHTFYSFLGIKERENRKLHIESRRFDEPVAQETAVSAETVLTIHGCRETDATVYIGGRDLHLKAAITEALARLDVPVREDPRHPGTQPDNICNRGRSGRGVQLEFSSGIRQRLFSDLSGGFPAKSGSDLFAIALAISEILSGTGHL